MKFGKMLQMGMYGPWKDYYIPYDRLKRLLVRKKFVVEKAAAKAKRQQLLQKKTEKVTELTPLKQDQHGSHEEEDLTTRRMYRKSISKNFDEADIDEFFPLLHEELETINKFYNGKLAELQVALEAVSEKRNNSYRSHHTGDYLSDLTPLRDLYVQTMALKSYCELNRTGFYKIVKKYDKTMGTSTLDSFVTVVDNQEFAHATAINHLLDTITSYVSRDKLMEWDLFAKEEKLKAEDKLFPAVKLLGLSISIAIFIIALLFPLSSIANDVSASRCCALVLLAVSLWITQAIPYFATALLIPALVTFMGILRDPNDPSKFQSSQDAAKFVLDHLFSHTTMLLLGGYTISCAFSRCQLELRVAAWLQKRLGNSPQLFLLAIMGFGLFLSMWISNHTAPILVASILIPIIRDLPPDSKYSKCLLLGLAYACNFGGMMTPISSLQNVLAVAQLEQVGVMIPFQKWLFVSIPFCTLCVFITWGVLLLILQPYDVDKIPIIVYERGNDIMSRKNLTIIGLSLVTIILFAMFTVVEDAVGDIGIISLCFVAIMFGSGILTEVDFNSLSWHTLFLLGGGSVLGKAVESSGLLEILSDKILSGLPLDHPWLSMLYILLFAGTVASFVSHTVASIILMPIISRIGASLEMPEVVVMGSAFAVSAAMVLPFSSFPNVNSVLIVDDFQRPYLNVKDFIKTGLPMTLLTFLLIATVGYGLIDCIV